VNTKLSIKEERCISLQYRIKKDLHGLHFMSFGKRQKLYIHTYIHTYVPIYIQAATRYLFL